MANHKDKAEKTDNKKVFRVNKEMDTHIDKRAKNFDSYSGYLRYLVRKDMEETQTEEPKQ